MDHHATREDAVLAEPEASSSGVLLTSGGPSPEAELRQ
jgi:hypothetical protein